MTISKIPTASPLFPNLQVLHCKYKAKAMPLLQLSFPSLDLLHVNLRTSDSFQEFFHSFPELSPNTTGLFIRTGQSEDMFPIIEPSHIGRWQNLRSVVCPELILGVDTLLHLSRMPALVQLSFMLRITFPAFHSPLVFPNLHHLTLHSVHLDTISQFLLQVQLPAITDFCASIFRTPSRQELSSFHNGVQTSDAGHMIQRLSLKSPLYTPDDALRPLETLLLEDLRPYMSRNLRYLELNMAWEVSLADSQVLELASAWPQLQHLQINADQGWGPPNGVTPGGLIRLLQMCRSLSQIALRLDVRGYTESPDCHAPAIIGLTLPPAMVINVLDSSITRENLHALTTFFSGIASCSDLAFIHWDGLGMTGYRDAMIYKLLWNAVSVHLT